MAKASAINAWRQMLARCNQRRLLVIAGPRDWGEARLAELHAGWPGRWLSIGAGLPKGAETLRLGDPAAALGGEWDVAVIDAWTGLRPDMLGALGGTVAGGGLLVLLAPPLAEWATWRDPDYRRMAVFPFTVEALPNGFWQRLRRLLDDPAVIVWQSPRFPQVNTAACDPTDPADRYVDQQRAVATILRTARGRTRRPLVLIADRGRGKSAALGLAAARLLAEGQRVLVTGPRPDACGNIFRHAALALDLPVPRADKAHAALSFADASLRFVPFDALLSGPVPVAAEHGGAALLLVDEAAALPVAVLERLLEFPRVIFATTVHGYEGSGRGFELRFVPVLDRHCPQWRRLSLQQPLRWAPDDPLERWLYRALLLDAAPQIAGTTITPPGGSLPASGSADRVRPHVTDLLAIATVSRDRLAADERLLRQIFGLLVQAHYRTSPDDLRQLLDGPNLSVRVACRGEAVVGVLLSAAEGPLPTSLHAEITAGGRRPRGHLLPQSLAFHGGASWALGARWQRIVRVAVTAEGQRQGIGSALVGALVDQGEADDVDCLGVSFAADASVLPFWTQLGFRLLRIGSGREAGGAGVALMMARSLGTDYKRPVKRGAERLCRQLPTMLTDHLRRLEPRLVAALLRATGSADTWDADDESDLRSFIAGYRPLESCIAPLAAFCRRQLAAGTAIDSGDRQRDGGFGKVPPGGEPERLSVSPGAVSRSDGLLLVGRLLQHRTWVEIAARGGFTGRPDAEKALRVALARLARFAAQAPTTRC